MKPRNTFIMVLVTAPDLPTARKLARGALAARLIACANLVPRLESHYWWEGKITAGREVLLLMKTTAARRAALEKWIVARHPYDTPEVVALPIAHGHRRYLDWVRDAVQ